MLESASTMPLMVLKSLSTFRVSKWGSWRFAPLSSWSRLHDDVIRGLWDDLIKEDSHQRQHQVSDFFNLCTFKQRLPQHLAYSKHG
jgi:hypothetical protein